VVGQGCMSWLELALVVKGNAADLDGGIALGLDADLEGHDTASGVAGGGAGQRNW
jgi:hypothetical protein